MHLYGLIARMQKGKCLGGIEPGSMCFRDRLTNHSTTRHTMHCRCRSHFSAAAAPKIPHNSSPRGLQQIAKAHLESASRARQVSIHIILKGHFDPPSFPCEITELLIGQILNFVIFVVYSSLAYRLKFSVLRVCTS